MYEHEWKVVQQSCPAVLIPTGVAITLEAGQEVYITQALGGSVTVVINGNLARVSGNDVKALGIELDDILPKPLKSTHPLVEEGDVDEELIWEQLQTCYDPEIPVNIVELGLIYDLEVTELEAGGYNVFIQMTLTAPGCGMGPFLVSDVEQKVAQVPNVKKVLVELVFDPPWDQTMMSDAAKLQLGLL